MNMFGVLFGWRKASKCKKLVRLLRSRLKLLKSKRNSIVRQSREDIAQLLMNGRYESAFSRVEQLFKDQSLLDAYDLLDHFCEFINKHFSYFREHKYCPKEINEAVSTLIFAAAWCGDLPELRVIKNLFSEHYGQKFTKAAAELYSGNCVNHEIREKLCMKFIPDDAKLKLINDIAKDYGLQLWYNSAKPHLLQLCGNRDHQLEWFVFNGETCASHNSTSGELMLASYAKHSLDVMSFTSEPMKLIKEPFCIIPVHGRAAQLEDHSPAEHMYDQAVRPSKSSGQSSLESSGSNYLSTTSSEDEADIERAATFSEILSQFHKKIAYLEEIEELQFNDVQGEYFEDKRIFLFNLSTCPLIDNYGVAAPRFLALSHHDYDEHDSKRPKSWGRVASKGNSSERKKKSCGMRLERRSDIKENLACQSGNCRRIYHQSSHPQNNHRRKIPPREGRRSSFVSCEKNFYDETKGYTLSGRCKCNQRESCCSCRFSYDMKFNCLEQPCCHFNTEDKDSTNNKIVAFQNDTQIMENKKLQGAGASDCATRYASSHGSYSKVPIPHIETEQVQLAPHSRTIMISPERPKGTAAENLLLSASSEFQHSKGRANSSYSHVHPKLPDYDELVAKFTSLKKKHLQRTTATCHGLHIT